MDKHFGSNASLKSQNKRRKVAFTKKEDQLINHFVNLLGTKKWPLIAKFVRGRTAKQCRDRYMNYLKPGLSNIEWTQKEDDLLLELYLKHGPKWSTICRYFKNRNQVSLKNRFIFLQKQNASNEKKIMNESQENINKQNDIFSEDAFDLKDEQIFEIENYYDEFSSFLSF